VTAIGCKASVWIPGRFGGTSCSRKAVQDGYCKQHHPASEKARRTKRDQEWAAKQRGIELQSTVHYGMHDFWCQVAIVALLQGLERYDSKQTLALIFDDAGKRFHV
jgi:hypothetical protein